MVMLTDITARKRAEEHQQVLLAELSHRVKNTLASIQAIATQTLRSAASLEAFETAFSGRVKALALAHGVLTQTGWSEAELGELIRQSVAPYLTSRADSVRLSGPPTYLPPRQVVVVMLMMHELAVNAAKYGALSNDDGQVGIEWTIEPHGEQRLLRLHWAESGGPPVRPPARKGFGTTLIERSIGHELDGQATFEYHPQGMACELRFPLQGSSTDLLREAEASAGRSGRISRFEHCPKQRSARSPSSLRAHRSTAVRMRDVREEGSRLARYCPRASADAGADWLPTRERNHAPSTAA